MINRILLSLSCRANIAKNNIWHILRAFYFIVPSIFKPDIVINGYYSMKGLSFANANFGDDINFPILNAITGSKIRFVEDCFFPSKKENLAAIGSLLEYHTNSNSIVWGSGAIRGDIPLIEKPKKICAVRGLLTKKYLEDQGVECPDIFGDPALLLPYIYSPKIEKRFKFGVIAHHSECNLPHVVECEKNHPEFLFIKFKDYTSWKSVIDEINSCEAILSSSLHGLIVADAYHIPNVMVKLSNGILGGSFKYKDYFSGVGRQFVEPIDMTKTINPNITIEVLKKYQKIQYNPFQLLQAFPYKLNTRFLLLVDNLRQEQSQK